MPLKLEPEQMSLLLGGLLMPDGATLGSLGVIHNERLYLDFRAPWEPEDGAVGAGKAASDDKKSKGNKK